MALVMPLLPFVVFVVWALLHFGRFRLRHRGRSDWGHDRGDSALLPASARAWWIEEIAPVVGWLVAKGVRANHVTYLGTSLSVGAAVSFGLSASVAGGYLLLLGGLFDILDGHVARRAGQATRRGAFLDSTLDRYADMLVLIGLAIAYRESWVALPALATLVGTVATSYTRARAEGLGLSCRSGLMQRPERVVIIGFAALVDPLLSAGLGALLGFEGRVVLPLALTVMAVLVNGTAVARVRTVYLQLRELETGTRAPVGRPGAAPRRERPPERGPGAAPS
jgi:phosphatidylglycerophosphate synthase